MWWSRACIPGGTKGGQEWSNAGYGGCMLPSLQTQSRRLINTCTLFLLIKTLYSIYTAWQSILYTKLFLSCLFSSPEPKAQVSFSDQNLSVVRRCRRRWRCRKLFTFSSSSPEPLCQFQPNLAQSILGWRGFKFIQIFMKWQKYIGNFK